GAVWRKGLRPGQAPVAVGAPTRRDCRRGGRPRRSLRQPGDVHRRGRPGAAGSAVGRAAFRTHDTGGGHVRRPPARSCRRGAGLERPAGGGGAGRTGGDPAPRTPWHAGDRYFVSVFADPALALLLVFSEEDVAFDSVLAVESVLLEDPSVLEDPSLEDPSEEEAPTELFSASRAFLRASDG